MQQINREGIFKTKRRGKGIVVSGVKMCAEGTRAERNSVRNEREFGALQAAPSCQQVTREEKQQEGWGERTPLGWGGI